MYFNTVLENFENIVGVSHRAVLGDAICMLVENRLDRRFQFG